MLNNKVYRRKSNTLTKSSNYFTILEEKGYQTNVIWDSTDIAHQYIDLFTKNTNIHELEGVATHVKGNITKDDPLEFSDSKTYKDRLKNARKKTGLDCGMMVACGNINNIKVTAVASDFDFLGASMASAEGEAFLYGIQHAIENETPFICVSAGGGMRMMETLILPGPLRILPQKLMGIKAYMQLIWMVMVIWILYPFLMMIIP